MPWNLAFFMGLYGCGALICREMVTRYRLGLVGLILLGAAYGVYEEALVDRYWFDPSFWNDTDIGHYSEFWKTNLMIASQLTVFHSLVSITASVLVVERLFPRQRNEPWVGRIGITIAAVVLFLAVPFVFGEFDRLPVPQMLAAAAVLLLFVWLAFRAPRLKERARKRPRRTGPPIRGLGWIAFACTLSFWILVYAMPSTDIPWPAGVLISLVPVALGIYLVGRFAVGDEYGPDALRVVTGVIWFFIVLDMGIGLAGRYDMCLGAIATALGLWWLKRQPTLIRT